MTSEEIFQLTTQHVMTTYGRQPVAFVRVWHDEGGVADAGQGGHVYQLLDRTVGQDLFQPGLVCNDAGLHQHVGPVVLRYFP